MSHFTTYVFTKTNDQEELDRLMLPYHEYECTGITDYCVHRNITEECQKDFDDTDEEDYNRLDPTAIEQFLEDDRGITNYYEEEPKEKPLDSYAVIKDGKLIAAYDFTNPNHKWDYYVPYSWQKSEYVDIDDNDESKAILKSKFDIAKYLKRAENKARDKFNLVKPHIKEGYITWKQAREQNADNIDKAREIYNGQASQVSLKKALDSHTYFDLTFNCNTVDDIATMNEEDYVKHVLRTAAPFWAMVNPEGEWIEAGHMGWWAVTWDEDEDFGKTWQEAWKKIPDDCYIWVCDCHT